MKNRDDFGGMRRLHTLENFENVQIDNKKLKELASFMESKGYKIMGAEDPTYESEGLLEFSKTTYAILQKDGTFYGGIDLPGGECAETQPTRDYSKLAEDLLKLKIKHRLNEANYTTPFDTTNPVQPTEENMKKRCESVAAALAHIEEGLNVLKNTPKLDWMGDIPGVISELEDLLGSEEESVGLRNLLKLYKEELKKN